MKRSWMSALMAFAVCAMLAGALAEAVDREVCALPAEATVPELDAFDLGGERAVLAPEDLNVRFSGGVMSWSAFPGAVLYYYNVYDDGEAGVQSTTALSIDVNSYLDGLIGANEIRNTGRHTLRLEAYDSDMNTLETWIGDYEYLSASYPKYEESDGPVTKLADSAAIAADGTLSWSAYSNHAKRYWYDAGAGAMFTEGLSVNIHRFIDEQVTNGELPFAGSYTITLTANREDGSQLDAWQETIDYVPSVSLIDINDVSTVLNGVDGEYAYTGSAVTPVPADVMVKSKVLKAGVDYVVSYRDNVDPGTGWIVITGTGRYTGALNVPFAIVATPQPGADPGSGAATEPAVTIVQLSIERKGSNGTVTLNIDEKLQLTPAFATASGWTVKSYRSGKKKVATVDASGLVTPKAAGKAKITIVTTNKKKATITVKVVDPYKPKGVSIAQGKTITVQKGQPLQLDAVLAPITARSELTWKSGKKIVATVDASGLVTPKEAGKAKITVTTRNKKKATITVKVVDPYKPKGISIAQGKTLTLHEGEALQLNAVLAPTTAQSDLTWRSGKAKVAAVDENGVVTALKKGKAKITVKTWNKKKATITIKVVK